MCSQFILKSNLSKLLKRISSDVGVSEDREFDVRIFPYSKAPTIIFKNGAPTIKEMQFSLIPSWSKGKKLKFSTHNARLDTIELKPTWKKYFLESHCLVPMTHFLEAVYSGPLADNIIAFFNEKEEPLLAAGISNTWVDNKTGEIIETFALLTDDPSDFVREHGHDRQPILLPEEKALDWLALKSKEPSHIKTWLRTHQFSEKNLGLVAKIDRPLKLKKQAPQLELEF